MVELLVHTLTRRDGGALGAVILLTIVAVAGGLIAVGFLTHALWTYVSIERGDIEASLALAGLYSAIMVIAFLAISWRKARARRAMERTSEPFRALADAFVTGHSAGRALRR